MKFIIPDIHGCSETFKALVERLRLNHNDELYLLGDYIDKGPGSKEVLDFIFELRDKGYKVNALIGNHEKELVDSFDDESLYREWLEGGGKEALESFAVNHINDIPKKYIDFIKSLPYYFMLDNFILVHAGFNFNSTNIFQDEKAMLCIREFQVDTALTNGRRIIHGHVPTTLFTIIKTLGNPNAQSFPLDNGCVYKDRQDMTNLLALNPDSFELIIQKNID